MPTHSQYPSVTRCWLLIPRNPYFVSKTSFFHPMRNTSISPGHATDCRVLDLSVVLTLRGDKESLDTSRSPLDVAAHKELFYTLLWESLCGGAVYGAMGCLSSLIK